VVIEAAEIFEQHIAHGIECRDRREFAAAIEAFSAACELRPEVVGARCELAFTHLQAGALDQARQHYLAVLAADPSYVGALSGLGQLCRKRGEFSSALDYLQHAAALEPERLTAQCDVAAVLRDLSRTEDARQVLRGVLERDPRNATAFVELGLLARHRGDYTLSAALFRQASCCGPADTGIRHELAMSLRLAGLSEAAEIEYRAMLARNPDDPGALVGLTATLRQRGAQSAALLHLRAALARVPGATTLRLELASVLRELTQLDAAEQEYHAVLAAQPEAYQAFVGLALIARQQGDHAAALAQLESALQLEPELPGLRCEQALSLRHLERLDDAEAVYRELLVADPRSAAALQGLSLTALDRGAFEGAIELAARAHALAPDAGHALLLAAIYRDAGRLHEAGTLVDEVLGAHPAHSGAWIERGLLLRQVNDRAGALSAFNHAATLDRERGYTEMAVEHLALGRPEAAREAYQAVLAIAPHSYTALLGLTEIEMLAGSYERCVEFCDSLIGMYSRRVPAYLQKCRALIQLDRADEAVDLANVLVEIASPATEADAARLEILRTCGRQKDTQAALTMPRVQESRNFPLWLEAILSRMTFFDLAGAELELRNPPAARAYERSRVLYVRALLADLRWDIEAAVENFDRALEMHADDPGAHHHLARLHFLRADADRALLHLRAMMGQTVSRLTLRGESLNSSQTLLGQLINELRLDTDSAARMQQIYALAPPQRIEELLALVRAGTTNLTPPAIYLLLSLRQAGELEPGPDAKAQTAPVQIPRKLIQFWDQPRPPEAIARLMQSWADAHPDYEYRLFDNLAARQYLTAYYPPEVLSAYRRATHPAQASDLFRLAFLHREGGFYIDADDRCVGHLSAVTNANAAFIVYQEQYATLGNNFIGCVPGEPTIGRALELAVECLNSGDPDNIWLGTGPGLLTRAFANVLSSEGSSWREWLRKRCIMERGQLIEVSWPHSISRYKETRRGWLRSTFKGRADEHSKEDAVGRR
jgi:tetratricopeptide (TPR) repeat protein